MYLSSAIVIDGDSLEGADISTLKPLLSTALSVEFPKQQF